MQPEAGRTRRWQSHGPRVVVGGAAATVAPAAGGAGAPGFVRTSGARLVYGRQGSGQLPGPRRPGFENQLQVLVGRISRSRRRATADKLGGLFSLAWQGP